jgi:hypothetical protein
MVLKNVVPALLGAALLAGSGATAAEYRADEFLSLDLSKAVLSPNPLGPPAQFGPVQVEAKSDSKSDSKSEDAAEAAPAPVAPSPQARKVAVERVSVAHPRVAHFRADKPRGAARTRLAHRNPLNAQAMDTRIQAWPCKSGGICNWKQ